MIAPAIAPHERSARPTAMAAPHNRFSSRSGLRALGGHHPESDQGIGAITVSGTGRDFQVKFASGRAEYEGAFQLVAANYQARGYEPPSAKRFRFTPHHVLPDTATLIAKHGDRVVATLSLVPDTTMLGLPMESIYGEEVATLRREGRNLAEATSLADTDLGTREFIEVFRGLIKLGWQYHLSRGGDSVVITVNPRHRGFYRKVLGFVPLGPRRSYPSVQDHPAEAYLLDVDLMRANAPRMYQEILGEPLPEAVLKAPRLSPALVRYFGGRSTQTDRRTIGKLLRRVENFGSPPRWREDDAFHDRGRPTGRAAWAVPLEAVACGC